MQLEIRQIIDLIGTVECNVPLDTKFSGISIDSRTVKAGDIFVAINTGAIHIDHAFQKGAVCAVIQDGIATSSVGQNIIRVENVILALGQLAKFWRCRFPKCKVVAITGSCGKTTTTQMIAHFLKGKFQVHCTEHNHNNQIGVPKTIFGIDERTEIAVIEIGTNHPGEIEYLARIARPDVAVITNIGFAHLEGFGHIEAVRQEKISLISWIRPKGLIVINHDEKDSLEVIALMEHFFGSDRKFLFFGKKPGSDIRMVNDFCSDKWSAFEIRTPYGTSVLQYDGFFAEHNMANALPSVAIARHFGVDWSVIQHCLQTFVLPEMRFEKRVVKGITVINDAYNANPDSMRAAIKSAKQLCKGRLVMVLGDMLELGETSKELHGQLGRFIDQYPEYVLVAIGKEMYFAVCEIDRNLLDTHYFNAMERAVIREFLLDIILPGDTVLFKGSRSMQLDLLCDQFCQSLESQA